MVPSQLRRVAILTATGVIVLFGVAEVAYLWRYIDSQHAVGTDLAFYRSVAQRWLDTGQLYLPHQLAGPYEVRTDLDVLYPPIALLLFVPAIWLPALLWWAIPLAIVGAVTWSLRPAPWTWPLIALSLAWPPVVSETIYGNSDIWIAAFVALGTRWGWPAVFAAIKPSLGFLALVGVRRRTWWIAAGALALVSIPAIPLWLDYGKVVFNAGPQFLYSLYKVPGLVSPVIAWFGRRPSGTAWRPLRLAAEGGRVAVPD